MKLSHKNFLNRSVILLFFNALWLSTFGQSSVESLLEKYRDHYLPEKVYIHTDKQIYATGEIIWMAVYLTDGQTHIPGTLSESIHVELQNNQGELVEKLIIHSEKGHAAASFSIPDTIQAGSYAVVAYTNYQLNSEKERIFKKKIQIVEGLKLEDQEESKSMNVVSQSVPNAQKYRLRFFPEGGECLDGIICKVAVVAEDFYGNGKPQKLQIFDSEGNAISDIETNKYGVGLFSFIPKAGTKYFGKMATSNESFPIQNALKNGYQLGVISLKDKYRIIVNTNDKRGLKGCRVILNLRGILLLDQLIEGDLSKAILDIPKSDLFSGVVTATLLDTQNQAMSERLFFVPPTIQETKLKIETDNSTYRTRDEVNINFQISNPTFSIINPDSLARISYSIIPESVHGNLKNDNIVTWLLLNSDLKDRVNIDDELLMATSRQNEKIIDDFLLTRGWRRFRWEPQNRNEKFEPTHLVEQGVYVEGRMGTYENPKNARPGKVFLSNISTALSEESMTDDNGNFTFGPYITYDTLEVLIQGRFKAGKKNKVNPKITKKDNPYVNLNIYENEPLDLGEDLQNYLSSPETIPIAEYKSLSTKMLTISKNYDSLSVVLDVIELKARRINKKKEEIELKTSLYQNNPDNRIALDSIPGSVGYNSVIDLLRRVPGIRISGPIGSENIIMRGFNSIVLSSTPTFFLDGFEVDIDLIRNYPVNNIEFVDVVRGSRAAIFGATGANGAILIYSRNTNQSKDSNVPGQVWAKIKGYHRARSFPIFDSTVMGNQNRPDIRTTIFWNPLLFSNESGIASDRFATSDQKGKFIIIGQGLSYDGRPLYGTTSFVVE